MPIKPQSAKAKGRNLQKWVRDRILANCPTLQPDDVRSTSMGAGGEDVQLSPAARKKFPFSVECKAKGKVAVYSMYEQAVENCPKDAEPLLVVKGDRKKPLAVVDAEWFLKKMVQK
jgi:hypothetical protein